MPVSKISPSPNFVETPLDGEDCIVFVLKSISLICLKLFFGNLQGQKIIIST